MSSLCPSVSTQFADVNLFARPTVLTAIDEDSFQLLQLSLEPWKFSLRRCATRENFVGEIEALQPSLVVMESMFSFEKTLRALGRVRAARYGRHVPVVLLSGYPDEAHRKQALDFGVTGYIAKPVVLENVQAYFTSLIDVFENRHRRTETI